MDRALPGSTLAPIVSNGGVQVMTTGTVIRRPAARTLQPLVGVGLTAAIALAAMATTLVLATDPAAMATVEDALQSPFGLLVLCGVSALTSATLVLPVPGLALTAVAATSAEPLLVAAAAGAGQAVGEMTGYLAGASGRSMLPQGPRVERLTDWMRWRGTFTVLALAALPNPLFDVAGILAGALRMPVATFLAATTTGKLLKNLVLASSAAVGADLLLAVAG